MKMLLVFVQALILSFQVAASEVIDAPPVIHRPSIDSGGPHIIGTLFFNLDTLLSQEQFLRVEPLQEVEESAFYRHLVNKMGRELKDIAYMKSVRLPGVPVPIWTSEERLNDLKVSYFESPHFITPLVAVTFLLRQDADKTKYRLGLESDKSYEVMLTILKKINGHFKLGFTPKLEVQIAIGQHDPLKLDAYFENSIAGLVINLASPKDSALGRFVKITGNGLRSCKAMFAN